jgi:hypothetical protein
MSATDIWQVLMRYKTWQNRQRSLMADYARSFQTEITEIMAQLEGEVPLAGYKLPDLPQKIRWKMIATSFLPGKIARSRYSYFKNNQPTLVFVVEFGSHLHQLRPIAAQLNRRKIDFGVLFLQTSLYQQAASEFENTCLAEAGGNWRTWLQYLQINLKALVGLSRNKWASRGKFLAALAFLHAKRLRRWTALRHDFSRLLDELPAQTPLVFFKAEGSLTKGLMLVGREKDRKILAVQHGWISREIKYHDLMPDTYLVWSDYFAQNLTESGAGCRTLTCGNPACDTVFLRATSRKPHADGILSLLFLPNSGQAQTPYSEVIGALKTCLEYLQRYPEARLTIKPHPADHSGRIARELAASQLAERVLLLDPQTAIPFEESHIVLTMNSSVGLEAAIYQKPLILLLSDQKYLITDAYIEAGIAHYAANTDMLETIIQGMLQKQEYYQEKCRLFTASHLAFPGAATEEVCRYLAH